MNYLVRKVQKKRFSAKLVSGILTVFVLGILLLSGPARAMEIGISVDDSDSKYSADQSVIFTVNVDIETNERIPVQNLTLKIYNDSASHSNSYLVASCTFNLAGTNLTACTNFQDITKINSIGYANASGQFGYGYGYNAGNWNTSNQTFFDGGYGYGYGYDSGYDINNGELKYNVTWNASGEGLPTSSAAGDNYYADLEAYADDSSGNYRIYAADSKTSIIYDNYLPNITAISTSQSGTTTKTVSLSVTTSENATCKYSTSVGYIYSNMTNTMSTTTNTTSHSQSFSYTSDTTATYYVGCQDTAGNAMITSNSTTATIDVTESGGGSSSTIYYTLSNNQFLEGYTKELKKNYGIKFNMNGTYHMLTLKSLTDKNATIEIASVPQTATLNIGDLKKFDITGDDYYDLSVYLDSISNNKAKITIKNINEKILIKVNDSEKADGITGDAIGSTEKDEDQIGDKKGDESKSLIWIWYLIALIVLLGVAFFLIRKSRMKR